MIRVAINGYGNLGRGVEIALAAAADMECVVVFSRRDPATVKTLGAPVVALAEAGDWADKVDVCINCGGSATDLVEQSPAALKVFNVVDSFDNHAHIPEHFATMDATGKESGKLGVISSGWDPGVFSMLRALTEAVLPQGRTTTFWGRGVSQGHSDAIRRIPGVLDAKQYTLPIAETVAAVKAGEERELTARTMHKRDCYVVAAEDADKAAIEQAIVTMPDYFEPYDTTVTFISAAQMAQDHSGMPHGGQVIRTGATDEGVNQAIAFQLDLDSNPQFTGSVLVATARACARMAARGVTGAATVFDLTLADLSPIDPVELRAHSL